MTEFVNPESVGLSTSRLNRVSTWLDDQISSNRRAGAGVLIGRKGEVTYFETAGHADVEAKSPFRRDTIARIYSMTKPITECTDPFNGSRIRAEARRIVNRRSHRDPTTTR